MVRVPVPAELDRFMAQCGQGALQKLVQLDELRVRRFVDFIIY